MVKRKRDYKAEYRHRIERALAKGLSRSQGRGHRRPTEAKLPRTRAERALEDAKLQTGLRFLRKEKSFSKAAKEAHISPERLRTYAEEHGIIEKRGRRWVVRHDLPRRVLIYADGRERQIVVGDFKAASLVGKYMSAVGSFLNSNDKTYLKPFMGKTVTDIDGMPHALEVRPNVLYRLSHAGGSSFEQVYRIVIQKRNKAMLIKTNLPNHGDYEARYRKALERLGTDSPKCAHCDVTNPFCLQLHHIAGQANDQRTIILCLHHHALITNAQKDHPPPADDREHPANRLGNIVLGIAELLLIAVEMLREAGRYLIELARAASHKGDESVS